MEEQDGVSKREIDNMDQCEERKSKQDGDRERIRERRKVWP